MELVSIDTNINKGSITDIPTPQYVQEGDLPVKHKKQMPNDEMRQRDDK